MMMMMGPPRPSDAFMAAFPIPGEPWCHLISMANYYSSLLCNHPPPAPGDPPYLVNGWQQVVPTQHSPFRILYGTHNPAVHGLVITSDSVIPNFSWTPRLVLGSEDMRSLMDTGTSEWPAPVLLVPAVHGRVLRLFQHAGLWYVASNRRLEVLPSEPEANATSSLCMLLESCLVRYGVHSVWHFTRDLDPDRCWFFALYPGRQTMLFVGTCRILPHDMIRDDIHHVDLDFTSHGHLPSSVPILPSQIPPHTRTKLLHERLHNTRSLQHTDLYDGLLLVNTQTLFAIRLCYPVMAFLSPLMKHELSLPEFLAVRAVQAHLVDVNSPCVDHATLQWYRSLGGMVDEHFGEHQRVLIDRIRWQVCHVMQWLPTWLVYVSTLCWDEWMNLDIDLQRLYLLLDYEHPSQWFTKILCNPKYTAWIAKLVVFCLQQWDVGTDTDEPEDA